MPDQNQSMCVPHQKMPPIYKNFIWMKGFHSSKLPFWSYSNTIQTRRAEDTSNTKSKNVFHSICVFQLSFYFAL